MMLEWSWPVCAITFFLLDEWVLISIKYLAQHFKMMRNVNPPKQSNEQCCMLYVLLDVLAKILFRITRPTKATVSSIINDVQSLRGFHQLAYIAKVSDTWIKFIITIIIIIIIIIIITMATIPGRLYRITFAPAQKPYHIGLLFTHKWFRRDFCYGGKLRRADLYSWESHIWWV